MPLPTRSTAILAAAGSRKTEYIITEALAVSSGKVLITTFTNENQRQIISRIQQKVGAIPPHITVLGWFSFLIQQCAKPYQLALTKEPFFIDGLNFRGQRSRYTPKNKIAYFCDSGQNLYREGVADFVCELNKATSGLIIKRLERIFSHIFIDEVQDLGGYDLDVLDLLLASSISVTMVGDPRQCTLSTNLGPRNKRYRGHAIAQWFSERSHLCDFQAWRKSYRSNQAICDFADALYPKFPSTLSVDVESTGHDGVFQIHPRSLSTYVSLYGPVTVLRNDKNANTWGLSAMNIGIAKGSTFDRVIIIPTKPILQYLHDGDSAKLKEPARLYVAATRARFSVTFVVEKTIPNEKIILA